MLYLDMVAVVIVAAPAMALGAPALGYGVGGAAWIVVRLVSVAAQRGLADVDDLRRQIGLGVVYSMARVWVLAGTIIALGVAATREDALTAGLLIFGAFSVYFVCSSYAHITRTRRTAS